MRSGVKGGSWCRDKFTELEGLHLYLAPVPRKVGEDWVKPVIRSVLILLGLLAASKAASANGNSICDSAALRAAEDTGVPAGVLMAIARVEAGRNRNGVFSPWPWTVNEAGSGSFFPDLQSAMDHVDQALANGDRNIDIGCFQVNIRWHSQEFDSLRSMFNPDTNAAYAARFLQRLLQETGSWEGAIGAYHSRQELAAESYLAKVRDQLDRLSDGPTVAINDDPPRQPRINAFPLLQGGGTGTLGSLVAADALGPTAPLLR